MTAWEHIDLSVSFTVTSVTSGPRIVCWGMEKDSLLISSNSFPENIIITTLYSPYWENLKLLEVGHSIQTVPNDTEDGIPAYIKFESTNFSRVITIKIT